MGFSDYGRHHQHRLVQQRLQLYVGQLGPRLLDVDVSHLWHKHYVVRLGPLADTILDRRELSSPVRHELELVGLEDTMVGARRLVHAHAGRVLRTRRKYHVGLRVRLLRLKTEAVRSRLRPGHSPHPSPLPFGERGSYFVPEASPIAAWAAASL